jgi:hypothetical protein
LTTIEREGVITVKIEIRRVEEIKATAIHVNPDGGGA